MKHRVCPVCGKEYTGSPALSRKDNKTDICPECGLKEALAAVPYDDFKTDGNFDQLIKELRNISDLTGDAFLFFPDLLCVPTQDGEIKCFLYDWQDLTRRAANAIEMLQKQR